MPNTNKANNFNQTISPYLNVKNRLVSKRQNIHSLIRRLKVKEQRKIKERFVFVFGTIIVLLVSGVVISF